MDTIPILGEVDLETLSLILKFSGTALFCFLISLTFKICVKQAIYNLNSKFLVVSSFVLFFSFMIPFTSPFRLPSTMQTLIFLLLLNLILFIKKNA